MSSYPGVALVVGAGSADGRAVCTALIRAGCTRIGLADVDASSLNAIEGDCQILARQRGLVLETMVQECSFQDDADIDATLSVVISRFGRLDYCANCLRPTETLQRAVPAEHGDDALRKPLWSGPGQPLKGPWYAWQRAVWLCVRAQVRYMTKQTSTTIASPSLNDDPTSPSSPQMASIVNISAVQGLASEAGDYGPICAAAHAIVGITRATAMDYLGQGVRLNCVCPVTYRSGSADDGAGTPATIVTAEDTAEAVVFLLGGQARAITGVALPVDAGWSLYHR